MTCRVTHIADVRDCPQCVHVCDLAQHVQHARSSSRNQRVGTVRRGRDIGCKNTILSSQEHNGKVVCSKPKVRVARTPEFYPFVFGDPLACVSALDTVR